MISPLMVAVNAGQTVDSNYIRQIIVKEIPHLTVHWIVAAVRSSTPDFQWRVSWHIATKASITKS